MHLFLSHNHRDKGIATPLATQLRLVGIDVWLDDWELKPGDSIPGKVNEALGVVDTVLVLWSSNSASSAWVTSELETAISRRISAGLRVIPARLDETELPALLQPLKWIEIFDPGDVSSAVREIAGIKTQQDLIKAVQQTIEDAGLDLYYEYFPGYGAAVGCPRCGASSGELRGWHQVDYRRDDTYAGVECQQCGWQDGGEI